MPLVSFDTPWKHQKTFGFLMLSGVSKETSGMKWVNDQANFLHADKHQSFLPVDFNTLDIKVKYS